MQEYRKYYKLLYLEITLVIYTTFAVQKCLFYHGRIPTNRLTDRPTNRQMLIYRKLRHIFKTDGDKIFKDLLTKKIFCKQILS